MANYNYGEKNSQWKGGTSIHKVGKNYYNLIVVGKEHHLCFLNTYAYLHRLNAEKKLGRKLTEHEVVTFKDGNTLNCELDNLVILENLKELRYYQRKVKRSPDRELKRPKQLNEMVLCRCGCGTSFFKYDKTNRPRYYVTGHNSYGTENTYKKDVI